MGFWKFWFRWLWFPLNEIFDEKDYTRLEKEFYERKGEIEEEEEEEELEEKEKERITDLENEALEKFTLINERWEKDVKEIVKDLPKDSTKRVLSQIGKSISNSLKKIRGFLFRWQN